MNGKKLLFIYNPNAGRSQIRVYLTSILGIFSKAGYDVTTYPTQAKGDALQQIPRWDGQFDRVVCCGGDGTLNEVVSGMLQCKTRVPVGYIPAGTTNDFAQSLGISTKLLEAADAAVNGRLFPCDVGAFNDQYFNYVAAFGVFTEVSYQTNQRLKTVLGHGAYFVGGPRSLRHATSYRMEVELNGGTVEGTFIYGMVSNATSVGGIKNLTDSTVALDDGMFEVTLVKRPTNPWMLGDIARNLFGSRDIDSPYIYACKANSVTIHCDRDVPWTVDGEYGGAHTDVRIRNLPRPITFVVPEETDDTE